MAPRNGDEFSGLRPLQSIWIGLLSVILLIGTAAYPARKHPVAAFVLAYWTQFV